MRYVHWLKIDGNTSLHETAEQFLEIENYLNSHSDANALLYEYNTGSFNWIVRLECSQNYEDLDLMVNIFSTKLRRLKSKPNNIDRERTFRVPEHYRKYFNF